MVCEALTAGACCFVVKIVATTRLWFLHFDTVWPYIICSPEFFFYSLSQVPLRPITSTLDTLLDFFSLHPEISARFRYSSHSTHSQRNEMLPITLSATIWNRLCGRGGRFRLDTLPTDILVDEILARLDVKDILTLREVRSYDYSQFTLSDVPAMSGLQIFPPHKAIRSLEALRRSPLLSSSPSPNSSPIRLLRP